MFAETIKSQANAGSVIVRYTPIARGNGMLVIGQKKCTCEYSIREIHTDTPGRAARFTKTCLGSGSDMSNECYDVFVGEDGEHLCDCIGFQQHGHCKHTAALDSIVGNGWINQSAGKQAEEPAVEIDEPIPGFDAFAASVPVSSEPCLERGWCACNAIGVPVWKHEGQTLCAECYAKVNPNPVPPGYAEWADEQNAKDEADPVKQAARTAHDDERSNELERRFQAIEAVRRQLDELLDDKDFSEREADRLVAKLEELETDLPEPEPQPAPKAARLSPEKNAAPGWKYNTARDLANDAAYRW